MIKFAHQFAVVAQMVEHQLPKLRVVGSIPIYRSNDIKAFRISGSLFFMMCRQMCLLILSHVCQGAANNWKGNQISKWIWKDVPFSLTIFIVPESCSTSKRTI